MSAAVRRFLAASCAAFAVSMAAVAPAAAQTAILRGLDKVTGHARDFRAPIGQVVEFGSLRIVARACEKRPAEETPEVSIYLEVDDTMALRAQAPVQEGAARRIFAGWMFATSPGLNALEHAVYDVWAIDCRS